MITNCGKAHLEGFGSEEGVRKGKGELFDFLRTGNGAAFIMKDYPYLVEMSKGIKEIFSYGTSDADVIGNVVQSDPYLEVSFSKGFQGTISTQLVGDYNLPNVLAAVSLGIYFGVEPGMIRNAIASYSPTNSRSQLIEKSGNKIILDAYNANPSSMKAAISNFARSGSANRLLVLGAMAELGENSLQEHLDLLKEIDNNQWKEVLLVVVDFLKTGNKHKTFTTPDEAGEWLKKKKFSGSYFLIKGSRSMKMEKILDYL